MHWPVRSEALPVTFHTLEKEMTAFHHWVPVSIPSIYNSVIDFLTSSRTPDPFQDLKIGSVFPFHITVRSFLAFRYLNERRSVFLSSFPASFPPSSERTNSA